MDLGAVRANLQQVGWSVVATAASTPDDLTEEVRTHAQMLGEITASRGHHLVERITPKTPDGAYPGSLSSKYGLGSLPLHTDTAHWAIPCRYLVMTCAELGPVPTPTILLDGWRVLLSEQEVSACRRAVFLIRNGRRSFYGSIREGARGFLRVDPGCMTPLERDGEMALHAFSLDRHEKALHQHDWKIGEILVIDNWRMLHGRGSGKRTAHGRILLRAMVR
jgi:hypothetical protein